MEAADLLIEIKNELNDVKKIILQMSNAPGVSDKWILRAKVMEFLDYGATQMAAFEKNKEIVIAKVGRRIFINRESQNKFLDTHLAEKQYLP
jgi:hypothetical protein